MKLFNNSSNYTSGYIFLEMEDFFKSVFLFLFDVNVVRNYFSMNTCVPVLGAEAHFVSRVDCLSIAALCLDRHSRNNGFKIISVAGGNKLNTFTHSLCCVDEGQKNHTKASRLVTV